MVSPAFPSADELQEQIKIITETSKDYDASPGPQGIGSRIKLIGQAQQLIASLTDPADMGFLHISRGMELVAIRTMMHLKTFQHIPATGSISLEALAAVTHAEESLLERLLRMLVCTGFVRQLDNKEYAHTKFSAAYATIPGPGLYFQLIYDESFLVIDNLHLFLEEKGWKEPNDQRYSPYTWKHGQEGKTVWEVMAQHPERLKAFQAGLAHASASIPLTGFYDFGQLKTEDDRPALVDIGGGAGQAIIRIMTAHPDIPAHKFVLQDLKEPIEESRKILPDDVLAMEYDFFTPQPIKGAKAYFLRQVMHDYSDLVCIDILKNIVPAMAPDSVLLVSDFCFPSHIGPENLPIATMDTVIFNMGGKERSEDGFREIFETAGLTWVKTWRSEIGFGAIVEARLSNAI